MIKPSMFKIRNKVRGMLQKARKKQEKLIESPIKC